MNVRAHALLISLAVVAIAACSSNSPSPTDGGSDSGGLPSCPQTTADYCAQHPGADPGFSGIDCVTTLAAAQSDPYFCGLEGSVTESDCQTYTNILQMGVDSGYNYYYDANGALFAITAYAPDLGAGTHCVAGPPTLALPHSVCASRVPLPGCATDGGGDGG